MELDTSSVRVGRDPGLEVVDADLAPLGAVPRVVLGRLAERTHEDLDELLDLDAGPVGQDADLVGDRPDEHAAEVEDDAVERTGGGGILHVRP